MGADVGSVILLGLIVGIPASLIGGTVYTTLALRSFERAPVADSEIAETAVDTDSDQARDLPGFGITLFTILLPLLIMVGRTAASATLDEGNGFLRFMEFFGHPIVALLVSLLFAYWSLGLRCGRRLDKLAEITDSAFGPIGGVLLIIGAGGAFNAVLAESGIAEALRDSLGTLPISPVILAWLVALVLHFAVGSATVAMISAAGIVLPILAADPSLNPAVIAIAVGAGAIGLTHVTDSLFWLYKEYMKIGVGQALKTLTVGTTIASVVGLLVTLGIDLVI